MIEKYQNIQCSTACWVWGCKVTDQLECPCPPLKVPTMDMCASEVGNRRRWPALPSPPFLLHHGHLCVCIAFLEKRWQQNIRSEEGKLEEAVWSYETVWNEKKSILTYGSWDCILYTEGVRSYTLTFFVLYGYHCILKFATQRKEVPAG